MRTIIYIVIIALLFLAPVKRVDVADLLPIEAVALYIEEGQVILETDTQNFGKGTTALEALNNLKETTPAVVYLDTAEYLIVAPEAKNAVNELKPYLKANVGVYIGGGKGRVKEMVKYLDVHGNTVKLKHWK